MRFSLLIALLCTSSALCQEAPVTRAEFAELFSAVARGYVGADPVLLPADFRRDGQPVTRTEVARAMLFIAIGRGKSVKIDGDALVAFRGARIIPETALFFTNPGNHFRPNDMVVALITYAEGMANRNQPRSADERLLTTPTNGRGGG